ncbi:MAG TPA: hypothetical protein PK360_15580, partial [bacterium]|nr:hypothetical protein [bacterium]
MDVQLAIAIHPSCWGLFDPLAPECATCTVSGKCIDEQTQRIQQLHCDPEAPAEISEPPEDSTPVEEDEPPVCSLTPGCQIIPKHLRKPLEIPPAGTRLRTSYKGRWYEAVVVHDPANHRSDGRSVRFNGEVYKTLTAAAHAIAPGINSGTV